jgi:hypothetical protein
MPDTFPILQKEGKLCYSVSHSSPELKLTVIGLRDVETEGPRNVVTEIDRNEELDIFVTLDI